MICDAVPRVRASKLAKADGVRVLPVARTKSPGQVHCATVSPERMTSLRGRARHKRAFPRPGPVAGARRAGLTIFESKSV